MDHVAYVLIKLFSLDGELILNYQTRQIDELELLELFCRLLVRLDHGCTYVHDHHDTKTDY
jgi:hypothetical protein